jgi:hypothetical protein
MSNTPSRRDLLLFSAATLATLSLARAADNDAKPKPKALIFDHPDKWTHATGLADQLKSAGFDVADLPLDRSPYELDADLIAFGSFASESPDYVKYMIAFGNQLHRYADRGHIVIQFAQADQTESVPPFLPTTLGVKRIDPDFASALILSPDHPLMKDVPHDKGVVNWKRADKRTIWETLVEPDGFEVIMAAEKDAIHPGLIEGAYGQGRIILAALDLDKTTLANGKPYGSEAQRAFAAVFFKNLYQHTLNVRNRTTKAIAITPKAKPPEEFVPGSWTLAVMPDTQVYSLRYPGLFTLQTSWILQNLKRQNIQYALQLGDIVNNNTLREWDNARTALAPLLGNIPLALITGNHDYGPSGDASTRDTHFNQYFPVEEIARQPTFGGPMLAGNHENTYHLFTAGGVNWILICLEWSPRDESVEWANQVMAKYPDRRGILITHAFVNNNDLRYDITDKQHPQDFNPHHYKTPGSKNDGEQLWQKLVRKHDFALVLNGHVLGDGTGYLATKTDKNRTCHQMLSNYQMRTLGGEGYLRLLEFRPDGKTVQVKTYSPLYDRYLIAPDQQFAFTLD